MARLFFKLLLIMAPMAAVAKPPTSVTITGEQNVFEGLTYLYTANTSGAGTWSAVNGTIIGRSNGDPANGAVEANIQWDISPKGQVDTRGQVIFTLTATGENFLLDVIKQNAATLGHAKIVAAPYVQSAVFGQPLQPVIAAPDISLPANIQLSYQWEYIELPNDFTIYATLPGEYDPRFVSSQPWQTLNGAISNQIAPPTLNTLGSIIYRCKVDVHVAGSSATFRTYITNICQVILSPLTAGTISHNPAYPFNPRAPIGTMSTPLNQPVLQIGETPGFGGTCSSIAYTWEVAFNNGSFTPIASTESLPLSQHPVMAGYKMAIRRKATCDAATAYTNTLYYDANTDAYPGQPYNSPWEEDRNYLRINTILKPGVQNWQQADQLPIGDKLQTTTYFDGLSRTTQQVAKEVSYNAGTGTWSDFVTHVEYDGAGRADKSFLSFPSTSTPGFFKTAAATEQPTFIRNYYGEDAAAPTWSKVEFENSPLSRPTTVKESGTWWGGNSNYTGIAVEHQYNEATENVRRWDISTATGSTPVYNGTYGDGTLGKQWAKDEKGKKVLEYTDYDGRTILKKVQLSDAPGVDETGWLCTYYIYDDFGRLRWVVPPKAVEWLASNSWVLPAPSGSGPNIGGELCFAYDYDDRGRMTMKHSPGAGNIRMIYDKRDRLVLTQDENQSGKSPQQWSFMLYDEYDRTLATGLFDKTESVANMQNYASGLSESVATISAYTGSTEQIKTFAPVAQAGSCNGCSNLVYNTIGYYDKPGFNGALSSYTGYSFLNSSNAPYPETSVQTFRVNGMPMGSKVRVINGTTSDDGNPANDQFLTSTTYYNEDGLPYQSLAQNIKGGTDVSTAQFDFTGKAIATHESHTMPGTAYTNYQTRSYRNFDKLGRTTEVYRQYGTNTATAMYRVQYDVFGRVGKKILSPAYNSGAGIETLDYTYNLHGQLIGINKDYALSTDDYAQWDHYFGVYLGYDNRAGLFTGNQYNGQLTGQVWKTQGDNTPRKWDYTYDAAGRFTGAAFTQRATPSDVSWSNGSVDCSVTNITYDANGNLLTMTRKGIRPGTNGGIVVDNLAYHYQSIGGGEWTNKLDYVSDNGNGLGSLNGALGDFKDANTSGADYDYDANGNTINDRNKNVKQAGGQGITWNYMDKPQVMRIDGRSTVRYIYDASGAKLGKTVTPVSSPAHTTWYMGSYLYEEDAINGIVLKYILHEEGRIRILTPQNTFSTQIPGLELSGSLNMPDSKQGTFEWMIKDQLGSTRMVLTEEEHKEYHVCTMEDAVTAVKNYEERNFGNVHPDNTTVNNEVDHTRQNTPVQWTTNNTQKVSMLIGGYGGKEMVGPNMFLKVMSGDIIRAKTNYFYSTLTGSGQLVDPILQSLIDFISGNFTKGIATGNIKDNSNNIKSSLLSNPIFAHFTEDRPESEKGLPKAYLNWLFFDENFNFIPPDGNSGGSGYMQIESEGDGASPLFTEQRVPKNGYAFVYVSNQAVDEKVFFDNLEITHERGRILEENTYYPDGLKIAGLCAKAYNKLPNEFDYQGNYAEEEEESGYDEFALRTYDPTIGRWLSTDPYDQFASPYLSMGNDPVNNVDPDGGAIAGTYRPPVPVGSLTNNTAQTVGQLTTAQGVSLPATSSTASSNSSSGGGALNALGNAVAGALGVYVANKLLPMPSGPDARQLQNILGAGTSSNKGPITYTNTKNKNGEVDTKVTINLSVIDPQNRLGGAGQIDLDGLVKSLSGRISVAITDDKGMTTDITANVQVTSNIKICNNVNEVRIDDYVIGMVNSIPGDPIGLASLPGAVGAVEYYLSSTTAMVSVIFHELGHLLGLDHEPGTFMNATVDRQDPKTDYRGVSWRQKRNIWSWIIYRFFGAKGTRAPIIPDNKTEYKEFIQKESIN